MILQSAKFFSFLNNLFYKNTKKKPHLSVINQVQCFLYCFALKIKRNSVIDSYTPTTQVSCQRNSPSMQTTDMKMAFLVRAVACLSYMLSMKQCLGDDWQG
jgi:hypothetical protein